MHATKPTAKGLIMLNLLLLAKLAFLDLNPDFHYSNLLPHEQAQQMQEWRKAESDRWFVYTNESEETNEQTNKK